MLKSIKPFACFCCARLRSLVGLAGFLPHARKRLASGCGGAPVPVVGEHGHCLHPMSPYIANTPEDTRPHGPAARTSVFSWLVLLAETYNFVPSPGLAICHSVLYPGRGLDGLLVHNRNEVNREA